MPYFPKLYQNGELLHRAKLVYIYLYDRQDKEHKSWQGINTIAKDLSVSRSTAKHEELTLREIAAERKRQVCIFSVSYKDLTNIGETRICCRR